MSKFPTLIVHIGAGKTGSTSIQFTLRAARAQLSATQLAYLGLTLEHVPGAQQAHSWCVDSHPQALFQCQEKDRHATDTAVVETVLAELARLGSAGVTRAVWSNEAFMVRHARILPILVRLSEAGVRIQPIVYVRRHDDWARSGYVQFGIKFKNYEGPLRDFDDWLDGQDISYAPHLAAWRAAFDTLEVYNFDAIADVTQHFLDRIGAPKLTPVRANDKPANALLAAWSVFNGRQSKRMMPAAFQRIAARLRILNDRGADVPPLDQLLPDTGQLEAVQQRFAEDLAEVNALLAQQGQPPMAYDAPRAADAHVARWEMERMMLTMIFSLQRQVITLEEELAALKDDAPPQR